MPLIKGKSKESFDKNLKTEVSSGKSLPQALAIAYAMKRKAQKMSDGGEVLRKEMTRSLIAKMHGHEQENELHDEHDIEMMDDSDDYLTWPDEVDEPDLKKKLLDKVMHRK